MEIETTDLKEYEVFVNITVTRKIKCITKAVCKKEIIALFEENKWDREPIEKEYSDIAYCYDTEEFIESPDDIIDEYIEDITLDEIKEVKEK